MLAKVLARRDLGHPELIGRDASQAQALIEAYEMIDREPGPGR